MTRSLTDIFAEALYLEPRLLYRKSPWPEMVAKEPAYAEQFILRAAYLIRLLTKMGVKLECAGTDARSEPGMTSDTVWRFSLTGGHAERIVRLSKEGEGLQVVLVEDGQEKVEQSFSFIDARIHAGMVLTGDSAARTIPGLGRELAAAYEACCVQAVEASALVQRREAVDAA